MTVPARPTEMTACDLRALAQPADDCSVIVMRQENLLDVAGMNASDWIRGALNRTAETCSTCSTCSTRPVRRAARVTPGKARRGGQ